MECKTCNGKGKIKYPKDEQDYEDLVEKYFDCGQFNMITSRQMALDKVGYDWLICPECHGKGSDKDK